ncbi:hypothetical protein ACJMK2_004358, partial [Sinanodonta woodiana]
ATDFEIVWVRDVTEPIEADKRGLGDHELPNQLTFSLSRGLDDWTLHLVRNYDIDPNADVYVVQKLKNGQSILARTNDKEIEDVAYYQDIWNMAFMTVRCAERSNHKCDRIINGNIQIGDCNYNLRPVESDFSSGRMSEVNGLKGKRYVLLDHAHVEKKAKPRQQKHDYYVKVAVLIDSGVWDLYASIVYFADRHRKDEEVRRKIREAYSHIMNGVNLRYKTIDDPSISITIILQQFIIFPEELKFPHNMSKVVTANGKKYIDAYPYHADITQWVQTHGINMVPIFDHAMLFTG